MKILLAVDGSSFSDAAVTTVARRPWPANSELKILSVLEPPLPPTPEAWSIPPDYFAELERAALANAQTTVAAACETLKRTLAGSVAVSCEYLQGSPKNVILEEAERWGADLIVVGSHGYPAWERFLMGSVSQAVVAHAKCSVEVVRNRKPVADEEARYAANRYLK